MLAVKPLPDGGVNTLSGPTKPVSPPVGLISAAPSGMATCPESKNPAEARLYKE